jgi:hypothetical protein
MKRDTTYAMAAALAAGLMFADAGAALAAHCANGVYRAGCVGPNGAVGVNKSTGAVHSATAAPYASAPRGVSCANGVYRAGCVGPNGAVGVNKSTGTVHTAGAPTAQCRWVNGQRICR